MRQADGGTIRLSALPEAQLLLYCARTTVDDRTARKIETLLRQNINWNFLLAKADQNCVMPLLCKNLLNGFRHLVPQNAIARLDLFNSLHTKNNLLQTGVLVQLLKLLATNRIPAIPLKGPALAVAVYGDSCLRQFGDLDILIPEGRIKDAVRLLASQGYEPHHVITWPEKGNAPANCEKDLALVGKGGLIYIELHWRLSGKNFIYPIDLERTWENPLSMSFEGIKVLTLPPEELLIYLCMHGSKHSWERLQWIADISELIRTYRDLDWQVAFSRARKLGCTRALNLGLFLAGDLVGADIPAPILKRIVSDTVVRRLADYVREWILRDPERAHSTVEWDRIRLMMKERRRDRIRLQLHHLGRHLRVNNRDRAVVALPASLSFLYIGIRTVRLVNQYALMKLKKSG